MSEKENMHSDDNLAVIAVDLQHQVISVDDVILLEKNTRQHDDRSIDAIAASLTKFGIQSPIKLSPDNVCLKGNGTVLAVRKLGWKMIPFSRFDLDQKEAAAYSAFDNRAGDLSKDDAALMSELLGELDEIPSELFTDQEMQALSDAAFSQAMQELDDKDKEGESAQSGERRAWRQSYAASGS